MNNIFDLYKDKKLKGTCERQLKQAFKIFSENVAEIQSRFREEGANDTASREAYSNWVEKQIEKGKLM